MDDRNETLMVRMEILPTFRSQERRIDDTENEDALKAPNTGNDDYNNFLQFFNHDLEREYIQECKNKVHQ